MQQDQNHPLDIELDKQNCRLHWNFLRLMVPQHRQNRRLHFCLEGNLEWEEGVGCGKFMEKKGLAVCTSTSLSVLVLMEIYACSNNRV